MKTFKVQFTGVSRVGGLATNWKCQLLLHTFSAAALIFHVFLEPNTEWTQCQFYASVLESFLMWTIAALWVYALM